jgi:hypothetical protein
MEKKERKKERKKEKGWVFKKNMQCRLQWVFQFFLNNPPRVEGKIHYITCPPITLPKLKQVYIDYYSAQAASALMSQIINIILSI